MAIGIEETLTLWETVGDVPAALLAPGYAGGGRLIVAGRPLKECSGETAEVSGDVPCSRDAIGAASPESVGDAPGAGDRAGGPPPVRWSCV